jgi:dephospho-CoA kinase
MGLRRVALTGGIATGKSYVRAELEKLGVPTIDADRLSHEAVAPGTEGLAEVVRRFGADVLDSNGHLNRAKMAAIVFADSDARLALEKIVHPLVRHATNDWFATLDQAGQHRFAVADIPLLYEVDRDKDFDAVIVAACDPLTQLRRAMERDAIGEDAARRRLAAQLPIDEKVRRADFVIRTDGTFEDTNRQVREVYEALKRMND